VTRFVIGPDVALRLAQDQTVAPVQALSEVSVPEVLE